MSGVDPPRRSVGPVDVSSGGSDAVSRGELVSICDWLPPDFGAVGQYALQAARAEAAAGRDVTLVGLSSEGDSVSEEEVSGGSLRVVRLAAKAYERSHLRRRLAWTLATNFRLLRRAHRYARGADEILFTGSPPFFLHFVVPANLFWRKRLSYRITDFHPECLIAELGRSPWWLELFRRWTIFLRRRVHRFEVLGVDQRRRLREIGMPDERIELRRDGSPVEISAATEPLPRPPQLADRVVLLYSGNFGVAHDDATFVDGYELHHGEGNGRVVLWLNATGAKADRVEAELRRRGLPLHRSRPVPLAELGSLLVAPDAHLITLREAFVGYVLPSKVYGCIASGRPILYVGSARSDVHLLASESRPAGGYWNVANGDAEGVRRALDQLGAESSRG